MDPAIRLVRILQFAFIVSVLLFFDVATRLLRPPAQSVNPAVQWTIVIVSIACASSGFLVQRMLRRTPNMPLSTIQRTDLLRPWLMGHLIRFAMAESVALFGFVLRGLGSSSKLVNTMFAASLLLLILWRPGEVPTPNESQGPIR